MRSGNTQLLNAVEMADEQNSAGFKIEFMEHWALVAKWVDNTPAAKTFTANAGTDQLTVTAHGLVDEQIVRLSTTDTLPAGLSTGTDYYVIYVDANTIKLATTRANAIAGTPIDITDAGTGTHTETPSALSVSMKAQYAVTEEPEEDDWVDSGLSIAIDPDPLIGTLAASNAGYRHVRLTLVTAGGSGPLTVDFNAKGVG